MPDKQPGSARTGGVTAAGAGRRREILDVAERLFWEKRFHATSMEDVADAIGLTKPAIYHYFRSKDDILVEIRQSIIDEMLELTEGVMEADGAPVDKLRDILVAHTEVVLRRRRANKVYHEESGSLPAGRERPTPAAESQYEDVVRGLYAKAVSDGSLCDRDPGIAVAVLLGAINWSYRWYRPRGSLRAPQMAELIVEILLDGHLASWPRRRGRAPLGGAGEPTER